MNHRLQNILDRLDNVVEQAENQYSARCPAHDDSKNSMSISLSDDGKVLMNCFAGCEINLILQKMGLELKHLYPNKKKKKNEKREIKAIYDYVDEEGNLLYQKVRFQPKFFQQRKPNGKGGWSYKLKGVRKVLYNLPNVIAAIEYKDPVFICEGEKDCDNLFQAFGLIATTNDGGASSKWLDSYTESLFGAKVIIIPDNDKPGKTHGNKIAKALHGKASVKIVNIPNLPEKGDISDFIKSGGTRQQLMKLVDSTDYWKLSDSIDEGKREENSDRFNKAIQEIEHIRYTEMGSSEIFSAMYKDEIRFVSDQKAWYCWDGKRWRQDKNGEVMRKAKCTAQEIYIFLSDVGQDSKSMLATFRRDCQRLSKLKNMIELAKSDSRLLIHSSQLDADDWLLNVQNGTVELKTGELKSHCKDDYITKICPVNYIENEKSDVFTSFLNKVLPDKLVREYVQRAFGYCISGSISEEILFFIFGPPSSGKSSILEAVSLVLGEYAATADFKSFTKKQNQNAGASSDIARLNGKRFVKSSEANQGDRFDSALVKQLTGGDKISARFLYREHFEFTPKFKLAFAANDRPRVNSSDEALWRRIQEIPFSISIPESERDPKLKKQLKDIETNGSAILDWLIKGCLAYQKVGLNAPQAIKDALDAYKLEMDPLTDFIEEYCYVHTFATADNTRIWEEYNKYCSEYGIRRPLGRRSFKQNLERKGFKRARNSSSRYWEGIGLLSKRKEKNNYYVSKKEEKVDITEFKF